MDSRVGQSRSWPTNGQDSAGAHMADARCAGRASLPPKQPTRLSVASLDDQPMRTRCAIACGGSNRWRTEGVGHDGPTRHDLLHLSALPPGMDTARATNLA